MSERDPLDKPTKIEILFALDCLATIGVILWVMNNNEQEGAVLIFGLAILQLAGMYVLAFAEQNGREMKKEVRYYQNNPSEKPNHPKDTWPNDKTPSRGNQY